MKYLPFITFVLLVISACVQDNHEDFELTRAGNDTDSLRTDSCTITITCDTTWKGVINYSF